MATIEDLYSRIIRAGVERNFDVVAEFCAPFRNQPSKNKKIDLVWLRRREDAAQAGSLKKWQIIAAFEIEGYDVPLKRLDTHSSQFKQLWREGMECFPCFVPLYTKALHRADPNWGSNCPEGKINKLIARAKDLGGIVDVRDGRNMGWLETIAR